MALTFSFKNVPEKFWHHPTKGAEEWHPVASALPVICMILGMSEITEKNLTEFVYRLHMLQAWTGGYWRPRDGVFLTVQDVKNFIGFRCNVTQETRSAWNKRMDRSRDELVQHLVHGVNSGIVPKGDLKFTAFERMCDDIPLWERVTAFILNNAEDPVKGV